MEEQDKNEDLWQLYEGIKGIIEQVEILEEEVKRHSNNYLAGMAALREQCSELLYYGAKAYSERARAEEK